MKNCHRRMSRLSWVIVALFLAMLGIGNATASSFDASLERDTINLGESVTLTLTFEGAAPDGQPNLPNLPGIQVANTGSSQQMVLNKSQMTTTTSFTYDLRPVREGEYTIPAFKLQIGGQQMASKPVKLKVLPRPAGAPETVFGRIVAPRTDFYVGETVPIELHFYCQADARYDQLPQFNGTDLSVGAIVGPQRPVRQIRTNNAVYNDIAFFTTVTVPASAAKSGKIELGPVNWTPTLLYGPRDFWGNYSQGRQVPITTDSPEINVLSLPTNNVPADFTGAIGTFALSSYEVAPTNVAVGDPITIKYRISGAGSFDLVTSPSDRPEMSEFKSYPPTSRFESNDPLKIEGSKYIEQVVTPQNADITELPAFSFSFFDPSQKIYRTLRHPAVPLTVRPTAATPQPTIISTAAPPADAPPPTQEIVHIKTSVGTVTTSPKPLIRQPGFLTLQALAPALWIGAVFWRRRKDALANNPRLLRQREVAKTVREGLKQLPALAQTNKTEEFYSTVFRLIQEQLGERLDLPASGITEAVLDGIEPGAINPETLANVRELFQVCNLYRYAPRKSGEEMASLLSKVEKTILALQQIKPASSRNTAAAVIGVTTLLVAAFSVHASELSTAFDNANRLYETRRYADAAAAYQKILDSGSVSSALYFNLGNAWFKAGQTGRAILAYRRAEALAPRDPDIRANLQFVRNQVGGGNLSFKDGWLIRSLDRLTLNEWSVTTSIAVAAFFLLLATRQVSPNGKKTLPGTTVVVGIGAALLVICSALVLQHRLSSHLSVVITPDTVVRRGPFLESQSVFTLRDGTELQILATKDDWFEVIDPAKHTGWVQKKDAKELLVESR